MLKPWARIMVADGEFVADYEFRFGRSGFQDSSGSEPASTTSGFRVPESVCSKVNHHAIGSSANSSTGIPKPMINGFFRRRPVQKPPQVFRSRLK